MKLALVVTAIALSGVTVALAFQDPPDGPGKDTMVKLCTDCHGIEQVTHMRANRTSWQTIINKMVDQGANGTDAELDAVVTYLANNYGVVLKINDATSKQIQDSLGLTAEQGDAIVAYRKDHGPFKAWGEVAKVPGVDAKVIETQRNNLSFQ